MHHPRKLLALAEAALREGDFARASRLAEAAARRGAGRAAERLESRIKQKQHESAALDALLPTMPAAPAALRIRWETNRALGRMEEAYAAARALAAALGDDLEFSQRMADFYAGSGDPEAGLQFVNDALARHPGAEELRSLALRLRVELEDPTVGDDLLDDPPADPAARAEVVGLLVQVGRAADAAGLVAGAEAPALRLWDARFALWAGETEAARARAAGLAGPVAARTRAAADVLDGRPAVRALQAIVADTPADGVAWAWLAEALEAEGRHTEAAEAARRAMSAAGGFNLTARMTRILNIALANGRDLSTGANEVAAQLTPLGLPARGLRLSQLREARARFGGNRTPHLTMLQGGRVVHYPRPGDPRDLAQRAQKLLVTRGPATALAAQTALHARFPGHPLLHTYRGEVHLWMGDYARAAEDFRASLAGDRHTKWAWIGLGASRLLRGDPRAALATFDEGVGVTNFAGPTLWIYRAESHLALGQREAGLEALHVARSTKPRRLSTWSHLALLAAEDGDPRPAEALCALVEERLPGLARDVGPGTPVARIQAWFRAWRGNRSSGTITWADGQGRDRSGTWSGVPPEVVAAFPAALRGG